MSQTLEDVVNRLVKPHAGAKQDAADRSIAVASLAEFAAGQKQRAQFLGIALLLLLVLPVALLLSSLPKEQLAFVFGGTGLFTAGTAKYLVDAMSKMSKAHALALVCQGLDSADAREVLNGWLKAKGAKK